MRIKHIDATVGGYPHQSRMILKYIPDTVVCQTIGLGIHTVPVAFRIFVVQPTYTDQTIIASQPIPAIAIPVNFIKTVAVAARCKLIDRQYFFHLAVGP
ncbi:hypothetical protein D3C81_790700 [compost metagenome]